jgi:hypothetical protein
MINSTDVAVSDANGTIISTGMILYHDRIIGNER